MINSFGANGPDGHADGRHSVRISRRRRLYDKILIFISDYLWYIQEHSYKKARTEEPTIVLGVETGEGDGRQHQC